MLGQDEVVADLKERRLVRLLPEWEPEPIELNARHPSRLTASSKVRVLLEFLAKHCNDAKSESYFRILRRLQPDYPQRAQSDSAKEVSACKYFYRCVRELLACVLTACQLLVTGQCTHRGAVVPNADSLSAIRKLFHSFRLSCDLLQPLFWMELWHYCAVELVLGLLQASLRKRKRSRCSSGLAWEVASRCMTCQPSFAL